MPAQIVLGGIYIPYKQPARKSLSQAAFPETGMLHVRVLTPVLECRGNLVEG